MENQLQFRISSALKNLIGKELITDEFVAVFELVKNSFDANAKHVKVIFENQYNSELAKIIIWDDGRGMSFDDLKNKWLFVAYSAKNDGTEDKDYRDKIKTKRIFAGAKGVGRFSCDRLGDHLNMITIKDEPNSQIENLVVDWTDFEEDSQKEFVDIKVYHSSLNSSSYDKFESGTILEITGLRDVWDRARIKRLRFSLEKLINPIQENDASNFRIEIIASDERAFDSLEKNPREKVNGEVKNFIFETLGLKTTQIITEIIDDGKIIQTELKDRDQLIYRIKEKNPYLINNIKIHLFQLNRSAKLNFKRFVGVEPVKYGSVFMYKNGFRIYPFGEEGEDILQIDRRKAQGYNRFLGTRDLIGRIQINGENSSFKETTSRDGGLIKNESYDELVSFFYEKSLRRLEKYVVDIIKFGDQRENKETGEINPELNPWDVKDEIFDIISNLTKAKEITDIEYDKDFLKLYEAKQEKSITQIVKNFNRIAQETQNPEMVKQAKAAEKQVKELIEAKKEAERENESTGAEKKQVEEKLVQKNKENLFLRSDVGLDKQSLISLQHHISHTANKISDLSMQTINAVNNKASEKDILTLLNKIVFENRKIATLSNFVSKAKFDTISNKIEKDVVEFINEYIENVYSSQSTFKINVDKDTSPFIIRFIPIELIIIIDNLLNNSIKANAKSANMHWENNGSFLKLHYIDDGEGISDNNVTQIFDYRFTTTGGGGLGLFHIKQIIDKLKGSIEVNNKIKSGVEFIITLRK